MTDSFGQRLRRERERRGIALADIAAHSKIKASLFEQLERDDVSHWPAGIFGRSFIRAYAQAIGVDPDETVREFLLRFQDPSEATWPGEKPDGDVSGAAAASFGAPAALRLTLVETGLPFMGGRVLVDARRRWSAAVWDLGSLVAIAVALFVVMGAFWMPFAVTALFYYVGGVLLLGNSPGVCLFGPRASMSGSGGPLPEGRATRARQADTAAVQHAAHAFRSNRWKQGLRTLRQGLRT